MHLLAIVSIIAVVITLIKEATKPTLTARHWANEELLRKDEMNGVSSKEVLKNAARGRYYIPEEITQAYQTPHYDPKYNKTIIENYELHKEDMREYGAVLTGQWVKQGKYNLNAKEMAIVELQLEKKNLTLFSLARGLDPKEKARMEEIDKILASVTWDYHKAEAVSHWQKARDAEMRYKQHT